MTVAELIEKLRAVPKDAEVKIEGTESLDYVNSEFQWIEVDEESVPVRALVVSLY